jgi:hypothetical protein
MRLPKAKFRRKADAVRAELAGRAWTEDEAFHAERLLQEYEHACSVRDGYRRRIAWRKEALNLFSQLLSSFPFASTTDDKTDYCFLTKRSASRPHQ